MLQILDQLKIASKQTLATHAAHSHSYCPSFLFLWDLSHLLQHAEDFLMHTTRRLSAEARMHYELHAGPGAFEGVNVKADAAMQETFSQSGCVRDMVQSLCLGKLVAMTQQMTDQAIHSLSKLQA